MSSSLRLCNAGTLTTDRTLDPPVYGYSPRMRIGFDVTPLAAPRSGVWTYTSSLLAQLQATGRDEIVPIGNRSASGLSVPTTLPGGMSLNKTAWMQLMLPLQLPRLGLDLCHFTNGVAPVASSTPQVVTIHDMTLWLYPGYHRRRRLLAMRPLMPLAARRAARVIAPSESARQDIVRLLNVPAERVSVVYEAADAAFRRLEHETAKAALRGVVDVPERFILHVGTIEPRKNLVRLLEAFAQLERLAYPDVKLLLAGLPGWRSGPIYATVERLALGDRVRFLGYVPRPALVALYNLAEALVLPSIYEGFGLPLVEAFACGTPVICSNGGSLPEIAGDAAVQFDPLEPKELLPALGRVLDDASFREELQARSANRSSAFGWEQAAQETRTVYELALSARAAVPAPV